MPRRLRQRTDQRESGQVDDQRAPRFAPLEVQRGLQRRDQVGAIEDVAVGSHRKQHSGDEQGAKDDVELRVPRLEGAALHEPAHPGICRREARRKHEDEPPGDRRDARELDRREQNNAEPHEPPARPRVRQDVLPLLRQALLEELMLETDHRRNR